MAQPLADRRPLGPVLQRTLTAFLIGLPVLGAVYFGRPWFEIMVAIGAAVCAWEWANICYAGRSGWRGLVLPAALVPCFIAGVFGRFDLAFAALGLAVAAVFVTSAQMRAPSPSWLAVGALYGGLALIAFLIVRGSDLAGRDRMLWVGLVVAATDIAAFFVGRTVGGPKLAPTVSPKKTWSGLLGGMLAAALVSVAFGLSVFDISIWILIISGAILALIAQAGDLFESYVKRRFGVKDASGLLPGHGGLLDRIDGLIAALLLVACLKSAFKVSILP
ncbi:MAG: phosphatidate cytidylyltransferase [Alphaproteobacteria bacterium]